MKALLKTALLASAIVYSQVHAQDQDGPKRMTALQEARAAFQTCMERTYQTPEGKIVGTAILLSPDPVARETRMDLMTSTAKLDAGQRVALKGSYGQYLRCRQDLLASTQGTPFEPIDIRSFHSVDLIVAKLLAGKSTISEANIALAQVRNQVRNEILATSNLLSESRPPNQVLAEPLRRLLEARSTFFRCMEKAYQTPEGQLVFGQILVPTDAAANEKRMDLMTSSARLSAAQKAALKDWPSRTSLCEKALLTTVKNSPYEAPLTIGFNDVDIAISRLLAGKYTIGDANIAIAEARALVHDRVAAVNEKLGKSVATQ